MSDPLSREVELQALSAKINALLPPQYQDCYDEVPTTSMGSAGLKFGPGGKVAWDEMWTSFCHLALAGGPAHRGTLLEAVSAEEARADPASYGAVVAEISRGIRLVTELPIVPGESAGWVGIECESEQMAVWMLRAVIVENVMARRRGRFLYVPAGPRFRLGKEIKNVITSVAKTHHYWAYHLLDRRLATVPALVEPATAEEARARWEDYQRVVAEIEEGLRSRAGLAAVPSPSLGWVGVPCDNEDVAVWLLRAILVEDVLARREGAVLFLPAGPGYTAGEIEHVVAKTAWAHRLWNGGQDL